MAWLLSSVLMGYTDCADCAGPYPIERGGGRVVTSVTRIRGVPVMIIETVLMDLQVARGRALHAENARVALSNAQARAARRHADAARPVTPPGPMSRLLRCFCK